MKDSHRPNVTSSKKKFVAAYGLAALGVICFVYVRSSSHSRAIAKIEGLGGAVVFEDDRPAWLPDWLYGKHPGLFRRAVSLNLSGISIKDGQLSSVRSLRTLQQAFLHDTDIGDAGLVHIARLTRLKRLWLQNTQIGDAGLEHLAALTRLERLSLDGTQVGDDGIRHLTKLTNLRGLSLDSTRVTDDGLAFLTEFPRLEYVSLSRTSVTPAAVKKLKADLPDCIIVHSSVNRSVNRR